ncbi:DUF262 domain-containing protein [Gloeothece verrucosa]|uniref:GmrSD restriction endonucleases N-terminal domain-containing protein n=1 Tax=Gloeothece verrucosa (strain PCC 7822) TaxID=497965 RepID=E0UBE6_GLOV7|nr:DUF262 domain-containing protein [Gloeothece verrucosa]ADN12778.1 protein of unknown function DUF262 [Gloeothece verrucosa PCC 7822]
MAEIGIGTNKKLLDLFNQMKNGSLILAPSFQRKLVWNNKHKESFIETILKGFPFPEIYLADGDIDLETQTSQTLVVDGQQRLDTIYRYVTSSEHFPVKNIKKFKELTKEEQTRFFDYVIVVRDLGRISKKEIQEIFERINSVGYALNAIEIQNSLYEGEFITTAKEILNQNQEIFAKIDLFTDSESARMQDLEYILLMMATLEEGGYFRGDKEIETYVKRYDDEYPNKEEITKLLKDIFDLINACKFEPDSLWNRKSSFFSLTIELAKFEQKNQALPEVYQISNRLKQLEEEIQKNKTKDRETDEYAQYYHYNYAGTTSKKARDIRGAFLRKVLEEIPVNQKLAG